MRPDLMQNCQLSTTAKASGGKDRRGYAVQSRPTECGAFIAPITSGYPEIIKRVCDRNTVQATADHLTTKDGSH